MAKSVPVSCSLLFAEKECTAVCKQSMMAVEVCAKQGNSAADNAEMAQLMKEVSTVLRNYQSHCDDVVLSATTRPSLGDTWLSHGAGLSILPAVHMTMIVLACAA